MGTFNVKDLVHWTRDDLNVHQIHEMYEGMDSESSPCSGFVTITRKVYRVRDFDNAEVQGNDRIESVRIHGMFRWK